MHFQGRYPFVGRTTGWNTVKMMRRRPLNSLSLDETVIGSLLKDAREFLNEENWHVIHYDVTTERLAQQVPIGISKQVFRIAEGIYYMGHQEQERVSSCIFFTCSSSPLSTVIKLQLYILW